MDFKALNQWGILNDNRPLLISGPCGAETREQVMETARLLSQQNIQLFRAGVWKPRTRPDSFEGAGEQALEWLQEVKATYHLPITIEVAQPRHVELALKAGIDVLWIGARTTVNPFLVQQLADSLKGIDVPVMIKNPVNPDLELWMGAIERFSKAGVQRMAAIHRGFSSYENSTYRNKPNWEIPIELKRRLPGIPLICDPSHICGNTFMLSYIAQFAMDLQYDGLMIESHVNPKAALSDAAQQLTPDELAVLIKGLVLRNATTQNVVELSKLEDLRDQIDELDDEIVRSLAQRMAVARTIGTYKHQNNITILQPERWEEIIRTRTAKGETQQLTHDFIIKMYNIIHEESIIQQTYQMDKEKIRLTALHGDASNRNDGNHPS